MKIFTIFGVITVVLVVTGVPTLGQIDENTPDSVLEPNITTFVQTLNSILAKGPALTPGGYLLLETFGEALQILSTGITTGIPAGPVLTGEACYECRIVIGALKSYANDLHLTTDELIDLGCSVLGIFNIMDPAMLRGLIERLMPSIQFILTERPELSTALMCGIVFEPAGCKAPTQYTNWTIDLQAVQQRKCMGRQRKPLLPEGFQGETFKILHLTDIHYDPHYTIGADAETCWDSTDLMCCKPLDFKANISWADAAQQYGDYRKCDLPLLSVVNALDHILATHKDISMMYLSGDFAPHDIWNTSFAGHQYAIGTVTDLILERFPDMIIIPLLGNHDVHPANIFSPNTQKIRDAGLNTNVMYQWAKDKWSSIIQPDTTFEREGYYVVKPAEDFTIIVVHVICYNYNVWLAYEPVDLGGQLLWLAKQLDQARNRGDKVHIVGHIPPATCDCWSPWGREFHYIIGNYSDIVSALFFGHTHWDEINLFYDPETTEPKAPSFYGSSPTTFTQLNPGYKIYEVDSGCYEVVDYEGWYYDMEEANEDATSSPQWSKLYQATEDYGMEDTLPESIHKFITCMACDECLFEKYWTNYHRDSSVYPSCDDTDDCRKAQLCRLVTPFCAEATVQCDNLVQLIDDTKTYSNITIPECVQCFDRDDLEV